MVEFWRISVIPEKIFYARLCDLINIQKLERAKLIRDFVRDYGLKFSTKLSEIKKQCTVLNSSDRFEELCEELQELQDKNKICLTQMHTSTQFDSEEVEDKIRGRRVMFRKDGRIKVKTFDVHFNLNSILFCK